MNEKNIAIVYMVAGMSSRFGGKIKQFAQVTEKETLIEYSLNQSLKAGFNKIIFIVGNLTEKPFKEKFGSSYKGIPIFYALQKFSPEDRDKPWGTTDALVSAKNIINEPFVVCNGDDIYGSNTFKELYTHLLTSNEEATIGYRLIDVLPNTGEVNRGIFKIDNNHIKNITETFGISKENLKTKNLNPESMCSQNIFALHPQTITFLEERLAKFKLAHHGDRKAECLLPTEISYLIESKKIKMRLFPSIDKWLGVTNPGDELVIRKQLEVKKSLQK